MPEDALLGFLVLVSVGIATLTAPALDAHYIAGVSGCGPLWIAQQMQTQDVWLVFAVRIALTPSAAHLEEVRSRLFECVGSHLVLLGFTLSVALVVASSTAPAPVVLSMGTQTGWGHRTRDPFACLHVATFNAPRLWLHDEAIHDGFPMLSRISKNVGVCCIQETTARDFTTLHVDYSNIQGVSLVRTFSNA